MDYNRLFLSNYITGVNWSHFIPPVKHEINYQIKLVLMIEIDDRKKENFNLLF